VNTYDGERFTWGKGWSARTALPAIADAFFAADPGARTELMEAGFTHRATENQWLFVSLDERCVLEQNPGQRRDPRRGLAVADHPSLR
jgi:hypothetical protein